MAGTLSRAGREGSGGAVGLRERKVQGGTQVGAVRELSEQAKESLARGEVGMDAEARERFYRLGWWRDATVVDDFGKAWRRLPDKDALVTKRTEDRTSERKTYREYAALVERAAGALIELGVEPGDVVAAQLPNWWQFNVVLLAAFRAGAAFNPILPAHRKRDVRFVTQLLGSKVLILPERFRRFAYAEMARELVAEGHPVGRVVLVEGTPQGEELSFEEFVLGHPWEEVHAAELARRRADPDQLAELMFTSGTTGEPKGVAHTHNTQFARARSIFQTLGLTSEDVVFVPSTVAHSTGLVYGCITPAMFGMKAVYQDIWDPEAALDIIEGEGVTWSFVTTTFVVDMIRAQQRAPRDLSSLRYLVCGGAAIPPAVAIQAKDVLGTRLMAVWGMTENGAVTCTQPGEHLLEAAESDGRPCPWMELKVVDPDTRETLGPGVVGELMARGASQMLGYIKRPSLTAHAFDEQGWFLTGDLARLDSQGHLRVTGRLKDIIVRGGENIPVAEVEAALYEHPDLLDVAVVSYPDERLGERACAFVVQKPGCHVTLEDLTGFLDGLGVAKVYWPERVEIISEMPYTLTGKVKKFALRALVGAGREEEGKVDEK